jgi:hypothetical protein
MPTNLFVTQCGWLYDDYTKLYKSWAYVLSAMMLKDVSKPEEGWSSKIK